MPSYKFNEKAFKNTVAYRQERAHGDQMTIILAAIDRKSRPVMAKEGELRGQLVELVTIRPLVSAGYDGLKRKKVYSVVGIHGPMLASSEWLSHAWVEDIIRRVKAIMPEGMPYAVRRFLLEGNGENHEFATARVYRWLSSFYSRLSLEPDDVAARESVRLLALAEEKECAAGCVSQSDVVELAVTL